MQIKLNDLLYKYGITIFLSIIYLFIFFILSRYSFIKVNVTQSMLSNMISIVIGSLSSIFGIVISVYILAFSLFEKNFNGVSFSIFVNSIELLRYFQLCVITILVMISANFLLDDSVPNVGINILGYGVILYVICLLCIYPTIKRIISESRSNKPIEALLNKLDEKSGKEFLNSPNIKNLSSNPFYILSILSRNLIINNEKVIMNNIMEKCLELMKDKINRSKGTEANQSRGYINSFVTLFKVFRNHAVEQNQLWVMHLLLENYINLRIYSVKNKIPYYDFIEFEEFIHNMCLKSFKNATELSRRYIHFLTDFLQQNIKYYLPDEEDLLVFQVHNKDNFKKEYDHLKTAQWDNISSTIFSRIYSITEAAIQQEEYEVSQIGRFVYNSIFSFILRNENMSNNQKRMLIIRGCFDFSQLIKLTLKNNPDYELLSTFNTITLVNEIEKNEDLNIILCNQFIELFPYFAKSNKLNAFTLNEYGTLGRSLSGHIDKGGNIELIMKKLVKIMVNTGKTLINTLDLTTLNIYIEIYKQVDSIIKWTKRNDRVGNDLALEMEEMLATMDEYEKINEMINDDNLYLEMILTEKTV